MAIDFITYQLQRIGERETHHITGVLVEHAARLTNRHRREDILAMYLSFEGEHRYSNEDTHRMLKDASGLFFHTQGSVTHAMHIVIDDLNRKILERNLDRGFEGVQAEGSINITVLHNNLLYLGQVGNAQTYLISSNRFERLGEDADNPEKLGCAKRIQPRLYQSEIQTGDLILMSPRSHGSWKEYYLSESNVLSMEQVKRRLHNQMIQDFSVLAIKTEEGIGRVRSGKWDQQETQISHTDQTSAEKIQENQIIQEDKIEIKPELSKPDSVPDANSASIDDQEKNGVEVPAGDSESFRISMGETEQIKQGETEISGMVSRNKEEAGRFLISFARIWMKGKTLRAKIQLYFGRIVRKLAPSWAKNGSEESFTILLALSVVIPLIIIISSLTVYSRSGKQEQFRIFINEANEKALLAQNAEDSIKQREYWKEVLDLSIKAEEYLVTNESRQLFQTAQGIIDDMDLTARLDFRPALTQFFPDEVAISQIKGGASGVYLLDNNSGNVLRIFLNTKGFYELDEEFNCSPGSYGLVKVTKIIDFIVLPANSESYKIMALDGQGNLLYCQPGEPPVSRTLTFPEGGWDRIVGTAYANDSIYVVDAGNSMVWIYEGNSSSTSGMSGIVFAESPIAFFDKVKPDLGGAIGASINQEDLYILHEDGHMTLCQYSPLKDVKLTECEDPAPFTDNRVGSENKNPWIFMGTNFIGMQKTRLPNSSLYILDDVSSMFYQFSVQLNLERTLKPQLNKNYPIPAISPSGFGITPDQEVFLAYNNQLFTAPLN